MFLCLWCIFYVAYTVTLQLHVDSIKESLTVHILPFYFFLCVENLTRSCNFYVIFQLNIHVIYAIFSIYWGRWTLQVLDVSIEKGVGYWIIIVLKKSKFITLFITWERWTLLTSIIAKKGIMKISIILGMIWLLYFSSPEIAEKR